MTTEKSFKIIEHLHNQEKITEVRIDKMCQLTVLNINLYIMFDSKSIFTYVILRNPKMNTDELYAWVRMQNLKDHELLKFKS